LKTLAPVDSKLTPLQERFVAAFISNGANGSEAIKAAGSRTKHPSSMGSQMLRKPHVRQAIRDALMSGLNLRMTVKALNRIEHLVDHADNEHVQLRASEGVLDRAGIAPQEAAHTAFKGMIRIDFRSPAQRDEASATDGTRGQEHEAGGGGEKRRESPRSTPSIHPTAIDVSKATDIDFTEN